MIRAAMARRIALWTSNKVSNEQNRGDQHRHGSSEKKAGAGCPAPALLFAAVFTKKKRAAVTGSAFL